MDANERFILRQRAVILGHLVGCPRFPVAYLADRNFLCGSQELMSETLFRRLAAEQEALEEAGTIWVPLSRRGGRRGVPKFLGGAAARRARKIALDGLSEAVARLSSRQVDRAPLARKLDRMCEVFGLDEVESRILGLYALRAIDGALEDILEDSDLEPMRSQPPRFIATLLDCTAAEIRPRIGGGSRLHRLGIFERDDTTMPGRRTLTLSEAVLKILNNESVSPERIVDAFYQREPAAELEPVDFTHLENELDLIVRLFRAGWKSRQAGLNVLLYGPPGVGKTQFARLVAKRLNASVFSVPQADTDGDTTSPSQRRMAHDVFQRLCQGERRPLLVVDEAEGLLGEAFDFAVLFGGRTREADEKKAWVTLALGCNPLPVIWIVNHHENIHPAARRRFALCIRFPELPHAAKRRVWGRILSRHGSRFQISAETQERLVNAYDLAPGHVARAVDSWEQITGHRKPELRDLQQLLDQTQRLCHGTSSDATKLRQIDTRYDPSLLEITGDLDADQLSRIVSRFLAGMEDSRLAVGLPHQVSLLFHGPSGAGKTELAKYLAREAGRRLQVERMSDLLSMWVGQSEQNIAHAFAKAADQGNVLLLDEFDSLAFDRSKTTKSWETSQINELLQQIENHRGVLIGCTNLVEHLDPAISRRFSHKIGFAGIRVAKRRTAVEHYFSDFLGGSGVRREQGEVLQRLPALYPGDLQAVRQRYGTNALLGETPNAEVLVAALQDEVRYHKGQGRKIGFQSNGVD